MRWWPAISVVWCACTCIRVNHVEPALERIVEAPVTLDEVRAAARPPDVTVTIETERIHREKGGGGSCAHAAVCALVFVLDPIVDDADEVYQVATITDHGVVTYRGVFRNEHFQGAWLRDGDRARMVDVVEALSLQRRFVLEVGTAPFGAEGEPGEVTPSSRLAQVDLGAAYLARLIADQKHHAHEPGSFGDKAAKDEWRAGSTIGEMSRVLSAADAARLARAWQAEPRLTDRVKQRLRDDLLRESMPVDGLEAATRGASVATILSAFRGAERDDDEVLVESLRVEGHPARVTFDFEHDVLVGAGVNFGEVCDRYESLRAALGARLGQPGALESYRWTWHLPDWDIALACHSADTSGWLHLGVRGR